MPELKRFFVMVPEVHYARVRVLATSPMEARALAMHGDGEVLDLEYSHVIETDYANWKVLDGEAGKEGR